MNTESGRSMVEMLGTLAIMGILSVGGIAGFHYGMNRHQANSIIEEAKMHAALITGQALTQGLPTSATLNQLSYEFTYHKESAVGYSLTTSEIEKAVCKILQGQRNLGWAETVLINNGADCKDKNQIAFYINTGMTTEITNEDRVVPCESDEDCGECGNCSLEQKLCVFDDFYCTDPDKPYCNQGRCQGCVPGQWYHPSTGCRSCLNASAYTYNVSRTECLACAQFYIPENQTGENIECRKCPGIVSSDRKSCDFQCPYGQYGSYKKSSCVSCTSTDGTDVTNATYEYECRRCIGTRFWSPLYKQCFLCTTTEFYNTRGTDDEDCFSCPNRYVMSSYCLFCTGFVNADGTECYDCKIEESIETTAIRCAQCLGKRYYNNGKCHLCPDDISGLTPEQQAECTPND